MAKSRLKKIHVNQHIIRSNTKNGTTEPPLTIKVGRENHRASAIDILGPATMVYSSQKPLLSCGARLILQTRSDIVLDDGTVVT